MAMRSWLLVLLVVLLLVIQRAAAFLGSPLKPHTAGRRTAAVASRWRRRDGGWLESESESEFESESGANSDVDPSGSNEAGEEAGGGGGGDATATSDEVLPDFSDPSLSAIASNLSPASWSSYAPTTSSYVTSALALARERVSSFAQLTGKSVSDAYAEPAPLAAAPRKKKEGEDATIGGDDLSGPRPRSALWMESYSELPISIIRRDDASQQAMPAIKNHSELMSIRVRLPPTDAPPLPAAPLPSSHDLDLYAPSASQEATEADGSPGPSSSTESVEPPPPQAGISETSTTPSISGDSFSSSLSTPAMDVSPLTANPVIRAFADTLPTVSLEATIEVAEAVQTVNESIAFLQSANITALVDAISGRALVAELQQQQQQQQQQQPEEMRAAAALEARSRRLWRGCSTRVSTNDISRRRRGRHECGGHGAVLGRGGGAVSGATTTGRLTVGALCACSRPPRRGATSATRRWPTTSTSSRSREHTDDDDDEAQCLAVPREAASDAAGAAAAATPGALVALLLRGTFREAARAAGTGAPPSEAPLPQRTSRPGHWRARRGRGNAAAAAGPPARRRSAVRAEHGAGGAHRRAATALAFLSGNAEPDVPRRLRGCERLCACAACRTAPTRRRCASGRRRRGGSGGGGGASRSASSAPASPSAWSRPRRRGRRGGGGGRGRGGGGEKSGGRCGGGGRRRRGERRGEAREAELASFAAAAEAAANSSDATTDAVGGAGRAESSADTTITRTGRAAAATAAAVTLRLYVREWRALQAEAEAVRRSGLYGGCGATAGAGWRSASSPASSPPSDCGAGGPRLEEDQPGGSDGRGWWGTAAAAGGGRGAAAAAARPAAAASGGDEGGKTAGGFCGSAALADRIAAGSVGASQTERPVAVLARPLPPTRHLPPRLSRRPLPLRRWRFRRRRRRRRWAWAWAWVVSESGGTRSSGGCASSA